VLTVYIAAMRLTGISTTCRDVAQLQPQAALAVDASQRLVASTLGLGGILQSTLPVAQFIASLEKQYGYYKEAQSWRCMEGMTSEVAPACRQLARVYETGFYEPLAFFGVNCLRAAQAVVDESSSRFGNSSIPEEQRIEAAESVGFEWASSRRSKSCLLQQQLAYSAKQMAAAVSET
jgi:hypothetical protein